MAGMPALSVPFAGAQEMLDSPRRTVSCWRALCLLDEN
jgi:hypothetical protein